jgi:GxxExxY protein
MELNDITYKVNGCAMRVHSKMGNGFQEVIYQRCLAIEFDKAKLSFGREVEQNIYYEGIQVGTRRADFVVEERIIVEIKAVIRLEDVHLAQAKNYVVAYNFPVGLLINFGSPSLEFKKVFNNNDRYKRESTTKTSESVFSQVWDNSEDAAYDNL